MPPKAAAKKAAAPKAGVTKKTAAATAATKKADAPKKTAKPAAKKDTATNGATAASKKRKLEEDDEEPEEEESADESADDSKLSNTKTTKKAAAPKKTAAAAKKEKAAEAATDDESKAKKPAAKKAAAKKEDTKKAAAPKAKAAPASKKRKVADEETEGEKPKGKKTKAKAESTEVDSQATESAKSDEETEAVKPAKATKKTAAAAKPPVHPHKIGTKINSAPTQILDIYVFGEGSSGELGLGAINKPKKVTDVKRPRLNHNLTAKDVGVVQIACGGMHAACLTKDNKILTWGVNDQGALGRDTTWDGGLRDVDDEEDKDDDDEDSGLNPRESTPTAVDAEHFAPEVKFTQVVASDSATFVLTEDGRVYGWGTFRSSDGILGFTEKIKIQMTPMFLPSLKNITALAAGSNHILALDNKGLVQAWGCGQQNQLGRRIIERNKLSSLVPQSMGIPKNKVDRIACGSYHSFAMSKEGAVWAWGLNNFAETGIANGAGEDDAVILRPTVVESLKDYKIKHIAGGEHHSLACTEDGKLLTWGRVDGHQVGIPIDELPADDIIRDESQNPRILSKPTHVEDVPKCVFVAAGVDNNFAIDNKGAVHSWGFSANYQTGQGTTEDVETPTTIDNSAIRDKKIVFAGAGGQYSILGGVADVPKVNGGISFTSNGQPATGGFRPVF